MNHDEILLRVYESIVGLTKILSSNSVGFFEVHKAVHWICSLTPELGV